MNAPKISHTVVLAKPDSAQVSAALYALKPGLASSAGANSTHCESTVTTVTPISPIAPPGSGSSIRPRMTPAKIAKKYHAWGARPCGRRDQRQHEREDDGRERLPRDVRRLDGDRGPRRFYRRYVVVGDGDGHEEPPSGECRRRSNSHDGRARIRQLNRVEPALSFARTAARTIGRTGSED